VISLVCAAFCGVALAAEAPSRDSVEGTNIFVVNADGTGRRNLTAGSDPAQRVLRALSPDGRTLAFDRARIEGGYWLWSIALVPARGGEERTLVSLYGSSAYGLTWSRDGKLMAYETCCSPHAISVVRPDGTRLSSIADAANPAWLAGPRLAFLAGGDVQDEVATAKPDGSDRTTVVTMWDLGFEGFGELTRSPNGRKFAFTAGGEQGSSVFSGGLSGLVGETSKDAQASSWSPTGRRLVFVTSRGLVAARPDGTGRRRFRATQALSPALTSWSPDGTRIAFVASNSGSLVVMNVRHGSQRVVARDVASQHPIWSPDGRRLYYAVPSGG